MCPCWVVQVLVHYMEIFLWAIIMALGCMEGATCYILARITLFSDTNINGLLGTLTSQHGPYMSNAAAWELYSVCPCLRDSKRFKGHIHIYVRLSAACKRNNKKIPNIFSPCAPKITGYPSTYSNHFCVIWVFWNLVGNLCDPSEKVTIIIMCQLNYLHEYGVQHFEFNFIL